MWQPLLSILYGWGVSKSFLGAPAGGGDGHGQKVTGTDKR